MSTGASPDETRSREWCRQCDKRTRMMNTPDGPKRCPACNPLADRQLPQFRTCPRCHSRIYKWDRNPCESHIAVTRITGAA